MVDLTSCLEQIKLLVDEGQYITINRFIHFGKATTLVELYNLKRVWEFFRHLTRVCIAVFKPIILSSILISAQNGGVQNFKVTI